MGTLKELLDIAIQGEVNSQKLYQRGVDTAETDEIKRFFEQLVKEETKHENLLFNIRETELYDLDIPVDDPEMFDAARSSHGNAAFDENWNTEEILAAAMKREYTAMTRYKKAAESTDNEELITLFTNLSAEESNHHKTIEKRYNMLKGLKEKEF